MAKIKAVLKLKGSAATAVVTPAAAAAAKPATRQPKYNEQTRHEAANKAWATRRAKWAAEGRLPNGKLPAAAAGKLVWVKTGDRDYKDSTGRFFLNLDETWILMDTADKETALYPVEECTSQFCYIMIAGGTLEHCKQYAQRILNGDPAIYQFLEERRAAAAGIRNQRSELKAARPV